MSITMCTGLKSAMIGVVTGLFFGIFGIITGLSLMTVMMIAMISAFGAELVIDPSESFGSKRMQTEYN